MNYTKLEQEVLKSGCDKINADIANLLKPLAEYIVDIMPKDLTKKDMTIMLRYTPGKVIIGHNIPNEMFNEKILRDFVKQTEYKEMIDLVEKYSKLNVTELKNTIKSRKFDLDNIKNDTEYDNVIKAIKAAKIALECH